MRLPSLLRTRVARRVLLLFLVCAILPVGILAYLSLHQVASELRTQSEQRLRQSSRTAGTILFSALQNYASALEEMQPIEVAATMREGDSRFTRIFRTPPQGAPELPPVTPAVAKHFATQQASILLHSRAGVTRLYLVRALPDRSLLWAEINQPALWHTVGETALGPEDEFCVFAADQPLRCSFPELRGRIGSQERFAWHDHGTPMVAAAWRLFLNYRFASQTWTMVIVEPERLAYQALGSFRRSFLLVALTGLFAVFLIAHVSLRRHLTPVEQLRLGTARIAAGEFSHPVAITSGDEFEELGAAFNQMGQRLDHQFSALRVKHELDRMILSSFDQERVVTTVLQHARELFDCDGVSVALRVADGRSWRLITDGQAGASTLRTVNLLDAELQELDAHPALHIPKPGRGARSWLPPGLSGESLQSVIAAPIRVQGRLAAVLAIGLRAPRRPLAEESADLRRFADQMAVALSNCALVEQLRDLESGALTALARTVDAKSPWTAGHSERVTRYALATGKALGLSDGDLGRLQRGGLVHDIGKIGVPSALLNKAGALIELEWDQMKAHPAIGARILEPITAYRDIIPMVLHHHERFDGAGYPHRLRGEAIPFLARVLAVADVFDALSSDRPYRSGWSIQRVREFMIDNAGTQFDPAIVPALLCWEDDELAAMAGPREAERAPDAGVPIL